MKLDISTIIFITSIIFATQAVAVFLQYKVNKIYQGLGWWLAGAVVQALGYLLMPLIMVRPIWMLSIAANPLVVLGLVFLGIGIQEFLGRKEKLWLPFSIYSLFLAAYAYHIFVHDSIAARSIIIYVTTAVLFVKMSYTLRRKKEPHFSSAANFTSAVFFAYAFAMAGFTVMTLVLPPLDNYKEVYREPIRLLAFAAPLVASMLWTFGYIIMVNQRLNAENREEEEKLRMVFNISPDAKLISRVSDGLIVDINAGFLAVTGYSRDEIDGKTIPDINLWENPDSLREYLSELCAKGSVEQKESAFRRKDERLFIGLLSGKIMEISGQIHAITVIHDITERKAAERKVLDLLAEKDLILKEVHHRIKNNMSTVYSLLSLQAGTLKDPLAVAALEDAGNRVQSMMMIYEKLYQSGNIDHMSVADYLPHLIDEIISNFPNADSVRVEKNIDDFVLDIKKLQPLGIIINELLTNIMKYAFVGREEGLVAVSARLVEKEATIRIKDNGNGMPEGIDFENSTGFGLQLVQALSMQLNGKIHLERGAGTTVVLEFPG